MANIIRNQYLIPHKLESIYTRSVFIGAILNFIANFLFIVILVDKLLEENSRIPAIVGLAVSLVCLLIFGADNFLIPAMIGIAGALVALKPVLNKNSSKENKEEKNE